MTEEGKSKMTATIKINMDNAAFEDGENGSAELGRILIELAKNISHGDIERVLMDSNGNTVGKFTIKRGK